MPSLLSLFKLREALKAPPDDFAYDENAIIHLPTELILPNPMQPRTNFSEESLSSLADSIRAYGIIQPLIVRLIDESEIYYELIAGERRLRAARSLGIDYVPCIVVRTSDETSAELAIIENLQRVDLDFFEQASAIQKLIDCFDMTQERIAEKLSVSQSYIANKLRLLRLTDRERALVLENHLTERHTRAVLRLPDASARIKALERIAAGQLNVAAAERLVQEMTQNIEVPDKPRPIRKLLLKDTRVFVNTVEHSVELVKSAGIDIDYERSDEKDAYCMVIRVSKY